ncbi:SgrR family transcriptional regulator [Mixta sp. Marseille-Q2659]|uniref:SgrR family transcriptional regulator n=1 Tax=Mixta sp. Marseille-Q2659 TaxID=2736607 RepID=UPI0023BA2434|nr:SgrR family transcriptional regulator [Mixta sp. Marseille-Q2659]
MIEPTTSTRKNTHLVRLARQYQRLLKQYKNRQNEVLLQDVADVLACTPRYARTLLKDMKQMGWISWASLPGRGKLSQLQCRLDDNALQEMTTDPVQPLISASFSAPLDSVSFPEGDSFILSYYRSLPAIVPSFSAMHASRHLIRMVHAGLMKYQDGNTHLIFGLAHHCKTSADRLTWQFYLRSGLIWHNEEKVSANQLLHGLNALIGTPVLPYVKSISADEQSILFHLTQPDEMLIHRLAHPACSLPHPVYPTVGLGPFRVVEHSDQQVKLSRFPFWYSEMPLAATITLETRLRKIADWGMISLETPQSKRRDERIKTITLADTFSFMAFNQCKSNALTRHQRMMVMEVARSVARRMILKQADLLPLPEWLTMPMDNPDPVTLPPTLAMAYFSTPGTDRFVRLLVKNLKLMGCQLSVTPIHNAYWLSPGKNWEQMDISLGYLNSRQEAAFTYEERWRHSQMARAFWPAEIQHRISALLNRSVRRSCADHQQFIINLMRYAIRHKLINPLYEKNHTLHYPASVRGIKCHPQCFPDFTSLWIDNADQRD